MTWKNVGKNSHYWQDHNFSRVLRMKWLFTSTLCQMRSIVNFYSASPFLQAPKFK